MLPKRLHLMQLSPGPTRSVLHLMQLSPGPTRLVLLPQHPAAQKKS